MAPFNNAIKSTLFFNIAKEKRNKYTAVDGMAAPSLYCLLI